MLGFVHFKTIISTKFLQFGQCSISRSGHRASILLKVIWPEVANPRLNFFCELMPQKFRVNCSWLTTQVTHSSCPVEGVWGECSWSQFYGSWLSLVIQPRSQQIRLAPSRASLALVSHIPSWCLRFGSLMPLIVNSQKAAVQAEGRRGLPMQGFRPANCSFHLM